MMDKKTITGIIGMIGLLLSGGYFLTQDQLDNAYFCSATESVGIFYGGTSGTGLSAYPYEENRLDYERCKKDGISGTWIPLVQYAEENDIDPLTFLEQNKTEEPNVYVDYNNEKYKCSFLNQVTDGIIKSSSRCEKIN